MKRMMKKVMLFSCLMAASCVLGAVRSFPETKWSEFKIENTGRNILVRDAGNQVLLSFYSEPLNGDYIKHVVVSQSVDAIYIHSKAAFDAGMSKLVFNSRNYDPKEYFGKDCTLVTELSSTSAGAKVLAYFEGHGKNGRHFHKSREISVPRTFRKFPLTVEMPDWLNSLHLRYDIIAPGKGPVIFRKANFAASSELPEITKQNVYKPELLFHASFDDSANADFAKGKAAPVEAKGLKFVPGKRGKALRITAEAKSVLAYEMKNNIVPERGTVSLWLKREWKDNGFDAKGSMIWRAILANENPPAGVDRVGSGQLWFWQHGPSLRADQSDMDDKYQQWNNLKNLEDWCHIAISWDEYGIRLYVNGKYQRGVSDGASPMRDALKVNDELSFNRIDFHKFYVGCRGNNQQIDGLIDDLRIYSAPLYQSQITELYRRESVIEITAIGCYSLANKTGEVTVSAVSPAKCDLSSLKYCIRNEKGEVVCTYKDAVNDKKTKLQVNLPQGNYTISATDGTFYYGAVPYSVLPDGNPYVLAGEKAKAALKAPGHLSNLELVDTLALDKIPGDDRYRSVGESAIKKLNGVPYLEAAEAAGSRFALRFKIDGSHPLYCFEIDYPDDKVRTADIIIQDTKKPDSDYTMQCGYASGDEYPNTGKVLTHRVLYWPQSSDVSVIFMTARKGEPAAVSAIRVYRVKGGALPAVEVLNPEEDKDESNISRFWRDLMNKRPSKAEVRDVEKIWNRSFALYFEDPAIGFDFATPKTHGYSPEELSTMIDRCIALMKYNGQNLLAYPGAWYHGLIGEKYNPRRHAPDFLSAWYAKFDDQGLYLMPTLNVNTMPVPKNLVTRQSMIDGTLHSSEIAIHDTGKPNWGGWHGTPPNFNIYHPKVQKYIEGMIDKLIAQGVNHKSFRGVCLHLTRHCMLWWGDENSGYNDYAVEAFAKAKGLKIPVDKTAPLRGKAYAEWIRKNAWNEWIQWRCDFITKFYGKLANKLADARPDLKLWVNSFCPAGVAHPDFMKADFIEQSNRYCGLDGKALEKAAPNIILCQSLVPADYRFRHDGGYPSEKEKAHQRILDTLPGFYSLVKNASFPWVNQHDRYWESPIGKMGGKNKRNSLTCDWLKECVWRVSTINPSGWHALRHFVVPLRYGDVLGMSKGGFLIGTYGMEDKLAPFIQAFRSLPAVVLDDVASTRNANLDYVRVRAKVHNDTSYFYVVNTHMNPVTVTIKVPARTCDLVTGERIGSFFGEEALTLELGPYEMRSFEAPSGLPTW